MQNRRQVLDSGIQSGPIRFTQDTLERLSRRAARKIPVSGLKADDQVVVNPPDSLVPGEQTKVVDATLPGDS